MKWNKTKSKILHRWQLFVCYCCGHNYKPTVYVDERYDVYVCTRCGHMKKYYKYWDPTTTKASVN